MTDLGRKPYARRPWFDVGQIILTIIAIVAACGIAVEIGGRL